MEAATLEVTAGPLRVAAISKVIVLLNVGAGACSQTLIDELQQEEILIVEKDAETL